MEYDLIVNGVYGQGAIMSINMQRKHWMDND